MQGPCVQSRSTRCSPNTATVPNMLPMVVRRGSPATMLGRATYACTSRASRFQANASGSSSGAPRVAIVGGGFGGLYAGIRLTQLFWPKNMTPQVTIIDKAERFTFKPLLYELLNNTATEDEVAPYFNQLLAPYPVQFIQDKVLGIELDTPAAGSGSSSSGGKIRLESGAVQEYDWLVVALGSAADSKGVPGVKELALPFNVYEDAVKVKEALLGIEVADRPGSTVLVVGAGYAGVELATVVAERVKGKAVVQLVTPGNDILDGCPDGQRQTAKKVLESMGVSVMTGTKVKRLRQPEDAAADGLLPWSCVVELETVDGGLDALPAALVLWSAGASPVTKDVQGRGGFPFPVNARGSVQTEPTLRVQNHERVFALGDVSLTEHTEQSGSGAASSAPLPATAQVAFQQADYVAWNLWASINKRSLLPFRYQHLGNMMSLGSLNAALALPVSLPLPLASTLKSSPLGPVLDAAGIKVDGGDADSGVTLEGPLAAVVRRMAYLYRQPTNEQRLNVASSWVQQAVTVATETLGAPKRR